MKTVETIGEEKFLAICQKHNLIKREIYVVRKILEAWDDLMVIPNFEERQMKKMEIGAREISDFPKEGRNRIIAVISETCSLLLHGSHK